MRVLIVDDEAAITELLEEVLGRLGHEVDVVTDGRTALARLEAATYDALVLDVRMPGMSGIDVLKALRAAGSPLAERAVFVCADRGPEIQKELAALGRPVIPKPFDLSQFGEFLRTLGAVEPSRGSA